MSVCPPRCTTRAPLGLDDLERCHTYTSTRCVVRVVRHVKEEFKSEKSKTRVVQPEMFITNAAVGGGVSTFAVVKTRQNTKRERKRKKKDLLKVGAMVGKIHRMRPRLGWFQETLYWKRKGQGVSVVVP